MVYEDDMNGSTCSTTTRSSRLEHASASSKSWATRLQLASASRPSLWHGNASALAGFAEYVTDGTSFAAAVKLNTDSGRYRYPNGLEVLPNGTALLSASSYPGSQQQSGAIDIEIWRTTNGGTSWTRTVLATPFSGVTWETSSTTALASDAAGNLVALYTGATVLGGNGHVWTRRSADSGATWAAAVEIGNGSADASFPAIAGGASGVFRLHYADNRTGSWNAYYRTSTDGGQTWSARAGIGRSPTRTGPPTRPPQVHLGVRDYGAIDITNTGKTVAVWGEGASFRTVPEGSGSTVCS